jgi:hypothetical protein
VATTASRGSASPLASEEGEPPVAVAGVLEPADVFEPAEVLEPEDFDPDDVFLDPENLDPEDFDPVDLDPEDFGPEDVLDPGLFFVPRVDEPALFPAAAASLACVAVPALFAVVSEVSSLPHPDTARTIVVVSGRGMAQHYGICGAGRGNDLDHRGGVLDVVHRALDDCDVERVGGCFRTGLAGGAAAARPANRWASSSPWTRQTRQTAGRAGGVSPS